MPEIIFFCKSQSPFNEPRDAGLFIPNSIGNFMTQHIGVKLINAFPMTRQAYNDFRGWQLPAGENGEDEGYLVGVFDQQIATLVHECAHVCFYVCSDVGVTTRPEDANETYCYMLDRMVNHFLPFIQEKQDVSLE